MTDETDPNARADQARKESPFLDTNRAADYVGLSRRTLEKMRTTGRGPRYRKHGRYVRLHCHIHAALDTFPLFVSTVREEFPDDFGAIVDDIIEAELGDFCWESRIAELSLRSVEDLFEEGDDAREEVGILGYFRGRYLVATCIVDADRRLRWMPRVRYFDELADAERAFQAMG